MDLCLAGLHAVAHMGRRIEAPYHIPSDLEAAGVAPAHIERLMGPQGFHLDIVAIGRMIEGMPGHDVFDLDHIIGTLDLFLRRKFPNILCHDLHLLNS